MSRSCLHATHVSANSVTAGGTRTGRRPSYTQPPCAPVGDSLESPSRPHLARGRVADRYTSVTELLPQPLADLGALCIRRLSLSYALFTDQSLNSRSDDSFAALTRSKLTSVCVFMGKTDKDIPSAFRWPRHLAPASTVRQVESIGLESIPVPASVTAHPTPASINSRAFDRLNTRNTLPQGSPSQRARVGPLESSAAGSARESAFERLMSGREP